MPVGWWYARAEEWDDTLDRMSFDSANVWMGVSVESDAYRGRIDERLTLRCDPRDMTEPARTSYLQIIHDPEIRAGEPIVEGTRVPVAAIVRAHQLGLDFDEILVQLPSLAPEGPLAALPRSGATPTRTVRSVCLGSWVEAPNLQPQLPPLSFPSVKGGHSQMLRERRKPVTFLVKRRQQEKAGPRCDEI